MMVNQIIGVFLISCLFFLGAVGGRIEGDFFPVTNMGVIEAHAAEGETWTRIWGHSFRLRHCSFDHLSWYLGHEDDDSRADLIFEEGTKVRSNGRFDFGPWLVQLTPQQLFGRSYAIVYHRCHPFWLTETRFYG